MLAGWTQFSKWMLRTARSRTVRLIIVTGALAGVWYATGLAGVVARSSNDPPSLTPPHTALLHRLTHLLESATAILDDRRDAHGVTLVLWNDDAKAPSVIEPHELCVLTHDRAFETLVLYEHDPAAADTVQSWAGESPSGNEIEAWMLRPSVRSTILATDVSDVSMEPLHVDANGRHSVRVGLIWSRQSADVAQAPLGGTPHRGRPTRATAVVSAVLGGPMSKEFRK